MYRPISVLKVGYTRMSKLNAHQKGVENGTDYRKATPYQHFGSGLVYGIKYTPPPKKGTNSKLDK